MFANNWILQFQDNFWLGEKREFTHSEGKHFKNIAFVILTPVTKTDYCLSCMNRWTGGENSYSGKPSTQMTSEKMR